MAATEKQISYIEGLAIDLGYSRLIRNLAISDMVGREVKFLDELSVSEASKVISNFIERKEQ